MRHEEPRRATSFLVIGTGAAGLRAAIELRQRGVDVTCVGKRRRDDAHTVLAASGINAALGTMDPEDSWEQHAADTLREAYGLADPATVEILAREAPRAIRELVDWGATLQTEPDGRLSQRYFGAHRYRRTCFRGRRHRARDPAHARAARDPARRRRRRRHVHPLLHRTSTH